MTWIANHNAWLPVFISAFIYYTFLSQSNTSLLSYLHLLPSYEPIPSRLEWMPNNDSRELVLIFENVNQNKNVFETVIHDRNASFFDVIWVEDAKLGRGYLLLSDYAYAGKVWRYETGGGLVPIGKSLYLEKSGCRSKSDQECGLVLHDHPLEMGSKGICLQVRKDADRFDMGYVIIVEAGERRVVRMEEDGARTPLVVQRNVDRIMYSPFGDLLFTERLERSIVIPSDDEESEDPLAAKEEHTVRVQETNVYRLREIVNYPSIPFSQSRQAHTWTETDLLQHWSSTNHHSNESSERLPLLTYTGMSSITSMVVGMDFTSLYISGSIRIEDQERNVIVKVPMIEEGEEDEDQLSSDGGAIVIGSQHVVLNMDELHMKAVTAMTLDQYGNLYTGHTGGLTIFNSKGEIKARLHVEHIINPTGLVIGNDGYLYMTTRQLLVRYKLKAKAYNLPTNLIVPTKKK